jgi:tyrosine-protein phosphatase YwqE
LSLIGDYSKEVKLNAELLIKNNLISYVGTDCHNKNHAQLYRKCETMKYWHQLVNSGKLLNYKL